MSLLPNDSLCRFIRTKDWSKVLKRPKPPAFNPNDGLSLWHRNLLERRGISLDQLRIGEFEKAGKAFHSVRDYHEAGKGYPLTVDVRPEPEKVADPWKAWQYAHYEAHTYVTEGEWTRAAIQSFRNMLVASSVRKGNLVAPDP